MPFHMRLEKYQEINLNLLYLMLYRDQSTMLSSMGLFKTDSLDLINGNFTKAHKNRSKLYTCQLKRKDRGSSPSAQQCTHAVKGKWAQNRTRMEETRVRWS
jgi:phage protein U